MAEQVYSYQDEGGALLFQVVRLPGKTLRVRRPDGKGGWEWKMGNARRVLYRLPELIAEPDDLILIVEGEKDVETLRAKDLTATTNSFGAGGWCDEYGESLKGRTFGRPRGVGGSLRSMMDGFDLDHANTRCPSCIRT